MDMLMVKRDAKPDTAVVEQLWLLGQPHLSDYLRFVKNKVVGGADISPRVLADEWRAASDLYYDMETQEAGIADQAECRDLDPALVPLAAELMEHRRVAKAFDTLPSRVGMVELDRLIVSQTFVTPAFTAALADGLGADPDPEALLRFCLPVEREEPPVRVERLGSNRYLFSSESTDLRPHNTVLLRPDQVTGYESWGTIDRLVCLGVGFGSNFLTVVRSEGRMVLQNGYHRAYALRSLGVTHAPCIVQEVTRLDELKITASEDVCEAPEFYFRAPRPPLLKDFFDPALTKLLPVRRMTTMVEVELKFRRLTATL